MVTARTAGIDLSGRVALVTGGSRGIGRGIALKLAGHGASVALTYLRNRRAAEETADALAGRGVQAAVFRANLTDPEHVERLVEGVQDRFGWIDLLVSNAASGVMQPVGDFTLKHWRWTMESNAWPLLALAQRALPTLEERGGRLIAISSLGAVRAVSNYSLVGASKGALESLARHLALELGPRGIRVNVVSASAVDTDALRHFPNREEILAGYREKSPLHRLVTPEDVANAVLFLCSPFADAIHGQTIVVDGGYSIVG